MSYLLSSYLGVNPVFVSSSHLHVCRCSPHLQSLPHLTLPRQFCQAQGHHVMINTNIATTTVISTKNASGAIPQNQNWIMMRRALTLGKRITLINIDTLRPGLNTGVHDFPLYTGWKFRTFSLKDTYLHFLTGAYFRAANQCWRETKVMFETNKYIWKPFCPNFMLLLCFLLAFKDCTLFCIYIIYMVSCDAVTKTTLNVCSLCLWNSIWLRICHMFYLIEEIQPD